MMGDPSLWSGALADSPMVVRAVAGGVGVLLWGAGARVYRPALALVAFAFGAMLGASALTSLAPWLPLLQTPPFLWTGTLLVGFMMAAFAAFAHKVGVAAAGGLLGFSAAVLAQTWIPGGALPFWVPLAAGVVGVISFPWLFGGLLYLITPAVGALLMAGAAGYGQALPLIAVIWGSGALLQWYTRPKNGKK